MDDYIKVYGILMPYSIVEEYCDKKRAEVKIGQEPQSDNLGSYQGNDDESKDIEEPEQRDPLADYTGPKHRAFDMQNAQNPSIDLPEGEDHSKIKTVIKKLNKLGEYRRLRQLPSSWRFKLVYLNKKFPNFGPVINYVRECCAIAELTEHQVISLETICLEGDPGCGKSIFSEHLAQFFDAGRKSIRMETAQSNSVLAGSEAFWSNSKHGMIFDIIALGTGSNKGYANCTILLDEIDKISGDLRYNPESALLSLFEKETAKKYNDLCYSFLTLDASPLNFICTANDISVLSVPLLSRMRVFKIDSLSTSQSIAVAISIVKEVLSDLEPTIHGLKFSESAIHELAKLSPRLMKRKAREAIGRVIYRNQSTTITENDFDVEKQKRRMGFL